MMAAAILSPRYDKPLPLIPLPPLLPLAPRPAPGLISDLVPDLVPVPLSPTKNHANSSPPTHIVHQFEGTSHHRRLRSHSPSSTRDSNNTFSKPPFVRTPRHKPSIERMQANKVHERAIAPLGSDYAPKEYVELPGSEVPISFQTRNMLQTAELPALHEPIPVEGGTRAYMTAEPEEWSFDSPMTHLRRQESSNALRGPSPPHFSPHPLRPSKSIPDKLSNHYEHRNFSAPTYTRPNRGYTSREPRRPPSPPRRHPLHSGYHHAEVRPSFYSNLTNGSSINDTTTTDRSSVMTGQSAQSDLPRVVGSRPQTSYGEEMSVEDAIAMYIEGFETDREIEKQIEEEAQDYIMPGKLEAPPALHVQKKPTMSGHAHRRSKSLTVLEQSPVISQRPSTATNLSPPPPGPILRSSTQVVANEARGHLELPRPAPLFANADSLPRDRYGFKKSSQYFNESMYNEWNQSYIMYLDRRKKKWIEFMGREGLLINRQLDKEIPVRFPARSDKTKRFIRKGIPPEWRGAAWFWYAGGPERLRKHPELYLDLVRRVEAGHLNDNDRELIERDLFRTFPDNIGFKPSYNPENSTVKDSSMQSTTDTTKSAASSAHDSVLSNTNPQANIETPLICSLRRVLQAFAIHCPTIGYCQSLNFLAALLLLLLSGDEEKSFHLLCILTTLHLPGTHGPALEGANVDIAVLMSLLQEHLPAVWTRVNDTTDASTTSSSPAAASSPRLLPTVSLATTSWFMSIFVGTLPIETTLRVWDVLFYEGSKTLFRVALALFKLAEPQIAKLRDPMEVFQLVQSLPRGLLDANRVLDTALGTLGRGRAGKKGFSGVSQAVVEERRKARREAIQRQVTQRLGDGEKGRGVREGGRTGSGLRRAVSKARLRRGKKEKELKL